MRYLSWVIFRLSVQCVDACIYYMVCGCLRNVRDYLVVCLFGEKFEFFGEGCAQVDLYKVRVMDF